MLNTTKIEEIIKEEVAKINQDEVQIIRKEGDITTEDRVLILGVEERDTISDFPDPYSHPYLIRDMQNGEAVHTAMQIMDVDWTYKDEHKIHIKFRRKHYPELEKYANIIKERINNLDGCDAYVAGNISSYYHFVSDEDEARTEEMMLKLKQRAIGV